MVAVDRREQGTLSDTSGNLCKRITQTEYSLLCETTSTSCDSDSNSFISVEHDTVVRLDEEIGDSARNVREETDRVTANDSI